MTMYSLNHPNAMLAGRASEPNRLMTESQHRRGEEASRKSYLESGYESSVLVAAIDTTKTPIEVAKSDVSSEAPAHDLHAF